MSTEYQIDAILQKRESEDDEYETYAVAVSAGCNNIDQAVYEIESMVANGEIEEIGETLPGHCPTCKHKVPTTTEGF